MNETELTTADFPVTVEQPVQWGEQDGFGHINNMYFIRWFESARIAYLAKCGVELTTDGVGPILAAVKCNFRRQVKYPATVIVGSRITRIGRSSMSMEHAMWNKATGELVADGDSTVVMFDYQNQKSAEVSVNTRQRIESLEGRSFG